MKKIDLHIHTIKTEFDSEFDFSIDKLKEYVEAMQIECIAITNHNIFDKNQYEIISKSLDIKVYPGIEIHLEKGHLLLISDDTNLDDFDSKGKKINNYISKHKTVPISVIRSIFSDLSKYIIIPHYLKDPIVSNEILEDLKSYITAGEVSSPKKFIYSAKNVNNLVPVLFSDLRMGRNLWTLTARQTYFDLQNITFSGIKSCLMDKTKVSLSRKSGFDFFQVLDNGLELSTGLNVILGERSSGKTHNLRKISEFFDDAKYIKQFSLLETDEEAHKKNFNKLITTNQSVVTQDYLKEFKDVVEDVIAIDLKKNNDSVEKYIETLLKNATETEKADAFSKALLFTESSFSTAKISNLKKLIEAVEYVINNEEYHELISAHVNKENLRALVVQLMVRFNEIETLNLEKRWLNELISNIQRNLHVRSASQAIEPVDLIKIALDYKKIEKFELITGLIKKEKEIFKEDINRFKIVANTKKFQGAGELKNISGKMIAFSDVYSEYSRPYHFLQKLKEKELLEPTEYYKFFVNIEYKILNQHGFDVSGGERSEFNLIQEISDARDYEMLLIDEPESSFDNLFLKNEVNELVKEISKTIPVVIVTHNNTVGASIKPNYIIYTEKEVTADLPPKKWTL